MTSGVVPIWILKSLCLYQPLRLCRRTIRVPDSCAAARPAGPDRSPLPSFFRSIRRWKQAAADPHPCWKSYQDLFRVQSESDEAGPKTRYRAWCDSYIPASRRDPSCRCRVLSSLWNLRRYGSGSIPGRFSRDNHLDPPTGLFREIGEPPAICREGIGTVRCTSRFLPDTIRTEKYSWD